MIENKKLFIISILLGVIVMPPGFMVFWLHADRSFTTIGLLFIIGSIISSIFYTLLYISLKKISVIKKIYKLFIALCIIILISGILMVVFLS